MKKGFWMEKGSIHVRDGDQSTTLMEPKRSYQWFVDSSEPGQFPNKKREFQNSDDKPSCSEMLYASINPWKNTSSFHSVQTQFREDAPIVTETCIGYPGISKLKVNPVKDCDYISNDETNFAPMGLVSHAYNNTEVAQNSISVPSIISFGAFPEEQDIIPVGTSLVGDDHLYRPASVTSDTDRERELDAPNTILNSGHVANPKMDSVTKHKPDCKATTRKEAPNSFPSNVRSLISTGMLDGVPVKYISLAREELRGFIKGSGYLCGCQLCNFSKVLNAYEFERHAGCKTKHPNNHIYFENGKTIYQIVQELRNTPESLLFDTIQMVFGAPINQKSFRIWKESFQAATRELQRIYGKEGLNL